MNSSKILTLLISGLFIWTACGDNPIINPEVIVAQQKILIRGTESGSSFGGKRLEATCELSQGASLRSLTIEVPSDWNIVGDGGSTNDPLLSSLEFEVVPPDVFRLGLEVHYRTELEDQPFPDSHFLTDNPVALETIQFGDRTVTLYKEDDSYVAFFPVITYEPWMVPGETGDTYAQLRIGTSLNGDVSYFSEADALNILRSAQVPECISTYYAPLFANATVEYIP